MELFEEEHFILLTIALGVGPELYWLPKAVIVHKGSRSIQQVAAATLIELYHHTTEFFFASSSRLKARLYALILLQAGLARYLMGSAIQLLHLRRHK